jgi:glycosyltransferase involved in cell wall biosynthesis
MSLPDVSILMPLKNAEKYIEQCIDSIQCQSMINWELLIIDDGSTDKSLRILDGIEEKDLRVKVLNNPGEGIISALNYGFERSSGKCISRMDADDIMPKNKLKILYNQLSLRENVVVTGKVRYFSDKKVSDGYLRYENWLNSVVEENAFKENLYRECVVASPNWMVHRKCFENDISFGSLSYPEDYDLVFEWFERGYTYESVNQITHLWREHDERTSRHSHHYQQPSFFRLKTARFIEHFKDDINGVQLIGKGEKGKLIAAILREHNINFNWYDLIPGERYKSVLDLEKRLSILSNWPLEERVQDDITEFLRKKDLRFGDLLWLF